MKLLFNMDITADNRIQARPSDYLRSLSRDEQLEAVREFLAWAETEARDNPDAQARAEAEIGVATAQQFLDALQATPRIYTGQDGATDND